jgi:hypothetical protein
MHLTAKSQLDLLSDGDAVGSPEMLSGASSPGDSGRAALSSGGSRSIEQMRPETHCLIKVEGSDPRRTFGQLISRLRAMPHTFSRVRL